LRVDLLANVGLHKLEDFERLTIIDLHSARPTSLPSTHRGRKSLEVRQRQGHSKQNAPTGLVSTGLASNLVLVGAHERESSSEYNGFQFGRTAGAGYLAGLSTVVARFEPTIWSTLACERTLGWRKRSSFRLGKSRQPCSCECESQV
jgi:hypothetical protein